MSEGKGLSDGSFKGVANEDYHLVGPSSEQCTVVHLHKPWFKLFSSGSKVLSTKDKNKLRQNMLPVREMEMEDANAHPNHVET